MPSTADTCALGPIPDGGFFSFGSMLAKRDTGECSNGVPWVESGDEVMVNQNGEGRCIRDDACKQVEADQCPESTKSFVHGASLVAVHVSRPRVPQHVYLLAHREINA